MIDTPISKVLLKSHISKHNLSVSKNETIAMIHKHIKTIHTLLGSSNTMKSNHRNQLEWHEISKNTCNPNEKISVDHQLLFSN